MVIPENIPITEYHTYIKEHYKGEDSIYVNMMLFAYEVKDRIEKDNTPLSNKEKRIIERFRTGVGFCEKSEWNREAARFFETPYTFDLYNEWEMKHLEEHPEDKNKSIFELIDIRLSEKELHSYKEIDGKYYGAEIPKEVPFKEYFRYLYSNIKYSVEESSSTQSADEENQETTWHMDRLFVAQEISEWNPGELKDWQLELIEKVRIGSVLDDDDIVNAMGDQNLLCSFYNVPLRQ